mgnify:CR=1 FL=1
MKTKRAVKVEYIDDAVAIKATKHATLDDKDRIVLDLDEVIYLIEDLAKQISNFSH